MLNYFKWRATNLWKKFKREKSTLNKRYKIIIWGCNRFSEVLTELLADEPVEILGYIDPETSDTTFCQQNIIDINHLKENVAYANIPIIIAASHPTSHIAQFHLDFESVYQFKLALQYLKKHQINNEILHPAALVDLLNMTFTPKALIFGIEGAGNTVFNHIFLEIARKAKKPPSYKQEFFTHLCLEYRHSINQVITDFLHATQASNHHVVPWKFGHTFAKCELDNEPACIFSMSTRDHIITDSFVYHQIPSAAYLREIMQKGFRPFFIIRNPLDIILSVLNKNQAINKATSEILDEHFVCICKWVIAQLSKWHSYSTFLPVLNYDKLLNDPEGTIQNMLLAIDIEPTHDLIKDTWHAIGFKQLPKAPNRHFWQGGSGKWEKYFDQRHLAYLKHVGIEEVLKMYGYHNTLDRFKSLTDNIDKQLWQSLQPAEQHFNFTNDKCSGDETRDSKEFIKTFYGEENYANAGRIHITTKNEQHRAKIVEMLSNDYVQQFILAGTHPEKRFN